MDRCVVQNGPEDGGVGDRCAVEGDIKEVV